MRKKWYAWIGCIIVVIWLGNGCFALPVCGATYTYSGGESPVWEEEWASLLLLLPEDVRASVASFTPAESFAYDVQGQIHEEVFHISYWWKRICAACKEQAAQIIGVVCGMLGILLLEAVAGQWQEGEMSVFCTMAGELVTAIFIGEQGAALLEKVRTYLSSLCNIMNGMIPVMAGVRIAAGEVTSATVQQTGLSLFVNALSQVNTWVLLPLGQALFALALIGSVCRHMPMDTILEAVKKCFLWMLTLLLLVYSFGIGMQNSLAKSADSLQLRTVKFALGSFVPLVGGTVSEAFSMVRAGLGYVKTMAGIGGILILLLSLLPIAVSLVMYGVCIHIGCITSGILHCSGSEKLFTQTRTVYHMIAALVWMTTVFFLFSIILFTKTAVQTV